MPCSCDESPIAFAVPPEFRECSPEGNGAAAICPRCLAVMPADDGSEDAHFARVSEGFPSGEAGVALGLLSSLATNRAELETALERVERTGTDPLLAIDRLIADPSVEPALDLERRRAQLESLLY